MYELGCVDFAFVVYVFVFSFFVVVAEGGFYHFKCFGIYGF